MAAIIDRAQEVHEALSEFIINATVRNAPICAIQALPEATKAYVDLTMFLVNRKGGNG